MSANTFGNILRLTTFGESHGEAIGGIIEGFPSGFEIDYEAINNQVQRRKTAAYKGASKRNEADQVEFLSGIFEGKTLGTPIAFLVKNMDHNSKDYSAIKNIYRPGHADFSWDKKFKNRDYRGGGRSSARETLARVIAGSLAEQYLNQFGIEIKAYVKAVSSLRTNFDFSGLSRKEIDKHFSRCPDKSLQPRIEDFLRLTMDNNDSVGGIIHGTIQGLKAGLGEPVFDKFQARLAYAMMGINAVKGFEYGMGFTASSMLGSEHNDHFVSKADGISTEFNLAGGILGGISTGEEIFFNVAFKPVASIAQKQKTVNNKGEEIELAIEGRHDSFVLPRAVPIVESMAALVCMDYFLMQKVND